VYWLDVMKKTGGLLLARMAASWNWGKLELEELRIMDSVGLSPMMGRNASLKTWNWAPTAVALAKLVRSATISGVKRYELLEMECSKLESAVFWRAKQYEMQVMMSMAFV
jgi:hypothetical protein